MTYEATIDQTPIGQVATNSGWSTFTDWAMSQDLPELYNLAAYGWADDLPLLYKELILSRPPEDGTDSIVKNLLAHISKKQGVLVVSDGTGGEPPILESILCNISRKYILREEPTTESHKPLWVNLWANLNEHYGPGPHKSGSPQSVHGGGKKTSKRGGISEIEAEGLMHRMRATGGFTYQPIDDTTPKSGYALSTNPEFETVFDSKTITEDDIFKYLVSHREVFDNPAMFAGGWHDTEAGKIYLDISHVTSSKDEAISLAQEHNQEGIFDLENFETIIVKEASERRLSQTQESFRPRFEGFIKTNLQEGGPGSGHHGHQGRPGEVGGSLPADQQRWLFPEAKPPEAKPDPHADWKDTKDVEWESKGYGTNSREESIFYTTSGRSFKVQMWEGVKDLELGGGISEWEDVDRATRDRIQSEWDRDNFEEYHSQALEVLVDNERESISEELYSDGTWEQVKQDLIAKYDYSDHEARQRADDVLDEMIGERLGEETDRFIDLASEDASEMLSQDWWNMSDGDKLEYGVDSGDLGLGPLSGAELIFRDAEKSINITNKGEAHEVFRNVVNRAVSYTNRENPDVVFFTAAEDSRKKLYDFFSRKAKKFMPGYIGFMKEEGTYGYAKAELVSKLKETDVEIAKLYENQRPKTDKQDSNVTVNSDILDDQFFTELEEQILDLLKGKTDDNQESPQADKEEN